MDKKLEPISSHAGILTATATLDSKMVKSSSGLTVNAKRLSKLTMPNAPSKPSAGTPTPSTLEEEMDASRPGPLPTLPLERFSTVDLNTFVPSIV